MPSRPPAPPVSSPAQWKHRVAAAWPWLAAPLSGGLLTLCFPPWNQQWLCWVTLTPLIAAVWFGDPRWRANGSASSLPAPSAADAPLAADSNRLTHLLRRMPRAWRRSSRWPRAFALGYLTGLTFYWGAFYWLTEVTGLGWFVLSFYMGLYGALWGWFIGTTGNAERDGQIPPPASELLLARRPSSVAAGLPSAPTRLSPYLRSRWNLWYALLGATAWVGLEWVRGTLFSGFGWNDLGVALHDNLPFLQIAQWTGVGGLSFLAAFANLIAVSTVYRFSLEARRHRVRPHFDFTLTIALLMLVFTFGARTLQSYTRADAAAGATIPLRVAAVQANVPQLLDWPTGYEAQIPGIYTRLTDAALASRPQLLLWPESATPRAVFLDEGTHRFVMDLAERAKCNFLLGTLDIDFGEDGRTQNEYNAALFLPKEGDAGIYRKIHLVPFGEYIPFRRSFPLFAWIIGDQVPGDFTPGALPAVFQTVDPAVRIAPLICFEDTLGRLARMPVQMGAQLLVNLTNDVWFGHSAANQQQLNESVFRAVENRRPLVRCANTGITAFIDRQGRVLRELRAPDGSPFVEGVLMGEVRVPTDATLTFYTRHGEAFSVACGAAALGAALLGALRNAIRARRKRPMDGSTEDRTAPRAAEQLQSVR